MLSIWHWNCVLRWQSQMWFDLPLNFDLSWSLIRTNLNSLEVSGESNDICGSHFARHCIYSHSHSVLGECVLWDGDIAALHCHMTVT